MIVTIDEMKEYLREDSTDEAVTIEIIALIEAAEIYLRNAGCILEGSNEVADNLAKLAVKQLVTHWYENKEPTGKGDKLHYGLASIITQLKYCYGGDNA